MFVTSIVGTALLTAGATIEQDVRLRALLEPGALNNATRSALTHALPLLTSDGAPTPWCTETINVTARRVLYDLLSDPSGDANANGYYLAPKSGRLAVVLHTKDGSACRYGASQAEMTAPLRKTMEGIRQQGGHRMVEVSDGWLSAVAVPLEGPGAAVLIVGVHILSPWHKLMQPGWIGFRFAILLLCLNAMSALVLVRILVRRIGRADQAATAWTSGELSVRIGDTGHDELARLSNKLDSMADALAGVIEIKQALASSEERNRMARDLHDSAKQRAFALNLQLSAAHGLLEPDSREARLLTTALTLTGQLQQDLSETIRRFGAPTIVGSGLRHALDDGVGSMLRGSGIAWQVTLDEQIERVLGTDQSVSYQLFLISMEAVANVLKHAGGTSCSIIGAHTGAHYTWRIVDNGRGFRPADRVGGMGWENMKLRAVSLEQGTFQIGQPGASGTEILITFQLRTGA